MVSSMKTWKVLPPSQKRNFKGYLLQAQAWSLSLGLFTHEANINFLMDHMFPVNFVDEKPQSSLVVPWLAELNVERRLCSIITFKHKGGFGFYYLKPSFPKITKQTLMLTPFAQNGYNDVPNMGSSFKPSIPHDQQERMIEEDQDAMWEGVFKYVHITFHVHNKTPKGF